MVESKINIYRFPDISKLRISSIRLGYQRKIFLVFDPTTAFREKAGVDNISHDHLHIQVFILDLECIS